MPLSFRQAGNLFVAGPNINIYPSGNTFAISGSASGGGGGSGNAVTGLTSAGTGNRLVFSSITNNNTVLVQKSLSAGTGVAIIDDGNGTLIFSATSAGGITGTYISGLTSAGTGNILILSSTTGSTLVQKSLSGGTGIAIIDSGTGTLTFSSTTTGTGTIISGTNVGTGTAVFSGVVGTNMVFRTLRGGLNANVFLSGSNIVISATTGAINGITALTNVGGGIAIASSVTNNTLISRTLSGANGIDVVESGNLVVVRLSTGFTVNRFIIAGTGGVLTTSEAYQFDSTVGTMTLGFNTPTSNVSSRLLIEAGNANVSQIRLTAQPSAYTGATAGDIWYNSTSGNTLFFNKSTSAPTPFIFKDNNFSFTSTTPNARILNVNSSGTINTFAYLTNLGIFNALTSTTISGTNELSIFNTGATFLIGTHILNSSTHGTTPQLVSGKKYRFNAKGLITTSAASAGNLIARMKLGSVLVASSTTALQTSISSNYFEINTTFTIRAAGSSGTVIGSGYMLTDNQFLISGVSNIAGIYSLTTSGVTINTTVDTPFDFTLQNSSQPNNTYFINEATLEYLN